MPLVNPRLGGPRKQRGTKTQRKVSREVARSVPLGRVQSPQAIDPVQAFRARVTQTGGTIPASGRVTPLTNRPLVRPRKQTIDPRTGATSIPIGPPRSGQRAPAGTPARTIQTRLGAGGTPTKSKTGAGIRVPVGGARKLLQTGRAAPRARIGATRRIGR